MADTKYEQTHPLYDAMLPVYRRNADLYNGGTAVEGGKFSEKSGPVKHRYLTQHPYEKNKQFAIRCGRAAYRNYAAPTVDLFSSSIMDGVTREGLEDTSLAPILKDCDRQGNTPDVFFKAVNTMAAAKGVEFVLVDMPTAQEEAITRADAQKQGLLPYFVRVPAENIIAWEYDDKGSLAWAVQKNEYVESGGPFTEFRNVKTITLWEKEKWTRYKSVDAGSYDLEDQGTLDAGIVPLVPFLYEPETGMTGRSVIDDVASLIIRVFNQDSELDKMLFDASLPILAAFGLQDDGEAEALVKATSSLWRFSSTEARLEYIEPSGASFSAKRQQILDDIESIREISLRQTKPKGSGVETAEAKRLDTVQLSSQLADFARGAEASEKRCWEIAAKMYGVEESAMESVAIAYNGEFDPDALREKLTQTFIELRRDRDISRETLWKQMGWTEEQITKEAARLKKEEATMLPSFGGYDSA